MSLEKITMPVKGLAEMLGINENAAYTLARRKDFPSIRVGRSILILKDKVPEWLEKESMKDKTL